MQSLWLTKKHDQVVTRGHFWEAKSKQARFSSCQDKLIMLNIEIQHQRYRAVGAGPAGPAAAGPIFGQLTRTKMPDELWWFVQLLR